MYAVHYNSKEKSSKYRFAKELSRLIRENNSSFSPIILLCIGTDRATGDCLGPIVGYKLQSFSLKNIKIYGTLENPVHAKNIEETILGIQRTHPEHFIIAIDACLGKMNHIGNIHLGVGSLYPGAGVNKTLPPVGDLYITGVVNFSGFMDIMILQNTRLNTVMEIADFITSGLRYALTMSQNDQISFVNQGLLDRV